MKLFTLRSRPPVCGRGSAGIDCALPGDSTFSSLSIWQSNFSDVNGWNTGPQYFSTIQFPDLDGDGRADICGRGGAGVGCALSTGSGFVPLSLWESDFSDAAGWNTGPQYYSTIRFPVLAY